MLDIREMKYAGWLLPILIRATAHPATYPLVLVISKGFVIALVKTGRDGRQGRRSAGNAVW